MKAEPGDEVELEEVWNLILSGVTTTRGDEKSFVLLNLEDGKVTLVAEDNLRGVNFIRGDFNRLAMVVWSRLVVGVGRIA